MRWPFGVGEPEDEDAIQLVRGLRRRGPGFLMGRIDGVSVQIRRAGHRATVAADTGLRDLDLQLEEGWQPSREACPEVVLAWSQPDAGILVGSGCRDGWFVESLEGALAEAELGQALRRVVRQAGLFSVTPASLSALADAIEQPANPDRVLRFRALLALVSDEERVRTGRRFCSSTQEEVRVAAATELQDRKTLESIVFRGHDLAQRVAALQVLYDLEGEGREWSEKGLGADALLQHQVVLTMPVDHLDLLLRFEGEEMAPMLAEAVAWRLAEDGDASLEGVAIQLLSDPQLVPRLLVALERFGTRCSLQPLLALQNSEATRVREVIMDREGIEVGQLALVEEAGRLGLSNEGALSPHEE